jgi:hypothetical protein
MQTITLVDMSDIHHADFNAARLLASQYGGRYLPSVTTSANPNGQKKLGPAFAFWNKASAEVFMLAARELSPHATSRIA